MSVLSGGMSALSSLTGKLGMGGGGQANKAKFVIEKEPVPLFVQFNPESYSVSETVEYHRVSAQGTNDEVTQYVGSVKSIASVSFYFDTDTIQGMQQSLKSLLSVQGIMSIASKLLMGSKTPTDVSALTERFSNLLKVDGDLHRPPIVVFSWGSINIIGVVNSMRTTFTMFDKNGIPVRAKVDCQIMSTGDRSAIRRSPLSSPDRTKGQILSEDTNLWEIANREYGDIDQWRLIARANGIMNPLEIMPGTVLKIPALTDL